MAVADMPAVARATVIAGRRPVGLDWSLARVRPQNNNKCEPHDPRRPYHPSPPADVPARHPRPRAAHVARTVLRRPAQPRETPVPGLGPGARRRAPPRSARGTGTGTPPDLRPVQRLGQSPGTRLSG